MNHLATIIIYQNLLTRLSVTELPVMIRAFVSSEGEYTTGSIVIVWQLHRMKRLQSTMLRAEFEPAPSDSLY